ncbi:DUF6461 domain-containing protein [Streptomyces griseorubiginosus]|uniref:Uncharacterized protein n=1 Tax=Streptomyces griseorubiginosus TaxID=67304 RepID=A0A101S652_9ACTN|nr:DUF6461 domain-containing protein [Streptomyces griseorubiginosus]KUN68180.1 hypothetical protein AQJ54_09480 [Streptomyces griseorubiginosus]
MTDGLRWVAEAYPFGYSLIFCEGLAPEEVLSRLGAPRESVFPLTRHEAQEIEVRNSMDEPFDLDHLEDLDVEAVEELGFLGRAVDAVVRAGETEGWTFAIQASTSYVSAVNYLPTLSSGSRVLAACCDVNATQRVEYAVDGRVLSSFDPAVPGYEDGEDPPALGWSADGGGMSAPQVLEYLESRFGLWVPKDSEGRRLPAAGLSTRR